MEKYRPLDCGLNYLRTPESKRISHVYHFMEFLNGGSLQWHLKHRNFNERETVFYSAQILCGILFLHSKQIVHRDIKLYNVLLDSNGNAKLCDFGFCAKINDTPAFCGGTQQYCSPESYIPGHVSYSLDFWSLGVCIYCMLTGELPFTEEEVEKNTFKLSDINEMREKNKNIRLNSMPSLYFAFHPDDDDKISDAVCSMVSKLLEKNLSDRLGNKEDNRDIKNEPFFKSINWSLLENGQMKPPIKPDVVSFDK